MACLLADDLELPRDYDAFLREWAKELGVSVAVLIGRIVKATVEDALYVEKMPNYYPEAQTKG
jgi:hypothetical protein